MLGERRLPGKSHEQILVTSNIGVIEIDWVSVFSEVGMKTLISRRFLGRMLCTVPLWPGVSSGAEQQEDPTSRDAILRDPELSPLGNPEGDVTIVEYFDYQCPHCQKVAPELKKLSREDGKIRIVLKDWPVFGEMSVYAARLILATKYQGRYEEAHDAVIGSKSRLSETSIDVLLSAVGIDPAQVKKDLITNQSSIDAILTRNKTQAEALGFQGTPAFIIGTFRVPGVPTYQAFQQIVADVRAGKDRR